MTTIPSSTVPASSVALLAGTRPWVRFVAVLGFGLTAIYAITGLITWRVAGGEAARREALFALFPVLIGLIYLPPAYFLWKYAGHIRRLQFALDESDRREALDDALRSQKKFWVYVGLALLLVGGGLALLVAGSVAVGMLSRR